MPVAEKFKAFGGGNGFPVAVPEFNCTIGSTDNPDGKTVHDYITLGGYKGSSGGSPTKKQIEDSLKNAMKIFWNLHGINASSSYSIDAEYSITTNRNYQQFKNAYTDAQRQQHIQNQIDRGEEDPEPLPPEEVKTINGTAVSSSKASVSGSPSSAIHDSGTPKGRLRGDGKHIHTVGVADIDTYDENDNRDTVITHVQYQDGSGPIIVVADSSAEVHLGGQSFDVGGDRMVQWFEADTERIAYQSRRVGNSGGIVKMFDNGKFVGYGVSSLVSDCNFNGNSYFNLRAKAQEYKGHLLAPGLSNFQGGFAGRNYGERVTVGGSHCGAGIACDIGSIVYKNHISKAMFGRHGTSQGGSGAVSSTHYGMLPLTIDYSTTVLNGIPLYFSAGYTIEELLYETRSDKEYYGTDPSKQTIQMSVNGASVTINGEGPTNDGLEVIETNPEFGLTNGEGRIPVDIVGYWSDAPEGNVRAAILGDTFTSSISQSSSFSFTFGFKGLEFYTY